MNRMMLLALGVTVVGAAVATRLGLVDPPVNLQAATPGTAQVGNANISGVLIAGALLGQSASASGRAVQGLATSATGTTYGGYFQNASTAGKAVYGWATAASGGTYGGSFRADSPSGVGLAGVSTATTGSAAGVYGQTAASGGRGVYGLATSAAGTSYGVYGKAASAAGFGVFSDGNMRATGTISGNGSGLTSVDAATLGGLNSAAFLQAIPNPLVLTGTNIAYIINATNQSTSNDSSAIFGNSYGDSGRTRGVRGQCASTDGAGVLGTATALAGSCYGGRFESASTTGTGVYGEVTATNGSTYGGFFRAASLTGVGVFGQSTSATGTNYGGWFESQSSGGRGVLALASSTSGPAYALLAQSSSTSGRGVYGYASASSGTIYGVYGRAPLAAGGYGVYANGDTGASGTKSFRIDHPLDPENKYLLHYASESPFPQNFYNGNVVTDATGLAWVQLPDYFAEVNTNFKYQLTVLGKSFAQAVVWEEIKANRFQIRTSEPNVKVSWEVKADRNDLYVRRKQPRDVVEKDGLEKGTYQHPELYGLGQDRGMDYDPTRDKPQQSPPAGSTKAQR